MTNPLYAPWRMDYIRGIDKDDPGGCFLCQAVAAATPEERKRRLVLWQSAFCVVVINRYPYTNGHLLVAPKAHKADFESLSIEEHGDLALQTSAVLKLLKDAMSPQGFNIGINLGRCAGAGVPGHLHQHIVPRWAGDTNFMSVVAETRVVPQAMAQLYDELNRASRKARDDETAAEPQLAAPQLSPAAAFAPVEAYLPPKSHHPLAVTGVVENGLVRPLDPAVKLVEHSRVIIVASSAT